MVRSKSAASWTIDNDILAWIDTKLGSKSEYVNKILLRQMKRELADRIVAQNRPKCPQCGLGMTPNQLGEGYLCSSIHCGAV